MDSAISSGASTSAQLFVLKDGQKLYSLSRGKYLAHFSDGDTLLPVDEFTVFDIASITKIVGMTAAMMKLFEEREYRLDDPIGRYWKEIRRYPWSHLPISNFLTHRTGLPPFLPLYQRIKNHPDTLLFDSMPTRLLDSVWRWICKTEPTGGFNAVFENFIERYKLCPQTEAYRTRMLSPIVAAELLPPNIYLMVAG
jgi:CubicO group peptidase (beta-lactamase class C family)